MFGDFAAKRVKYRCRASYHPRKKPCNLIWRKTGSNVGGNGKQYCKTSRHFLLPVLLKLWGLKGQEKVILFC